MQKILVLDDIDEQGIASLREHPEIEVITSKALSPEELRARLPGCTALLVRSATKVDTAALEAASATLKAIGRAGVGVDNIDVAAATRLGIAVFNSPAGNSNAAAEHTLALMFALARHVGRGDRGLREGVWDRKRLGGTELAGKVLGLVGLGNVARIVARVSQAIGMKVIAFDPILEDSTFRELKIERVATMDDLLPRCDWLSLHAPLNDHTRGMINARSLGLVKRGARLVNCARGALVDEEAVLEALRSGQLGGAALDVFGEEPCTESPLFELDSVVATPHLGASTEEAQLGVARDAAQRVLRFLSSGDATGAFNAAQLAAHT